jgi:type VI secretion system protein ImpL
LLSPLVEDLVKDDIARAQRFEDKSSLRSIPVNEAELRTDSQNFADTAELLRQLLKKLGQLRFTGLQTGLAGLVRSDAIDQLQAVNALLYREQLYEPVVGFAAWDGGPGLNLLAFAVPDQGALGAYLISQRERVATLANQYARPPLNYLVQSNQPAGPLMLRWRQLITDLDDYYSNRPDNPIADLENFILGELGTITAAGCSSRIAAAADRNQGDFFVLKRLELQRRVLARCDKVAVVRVNSAYRTLAAAFNNQLAGRFPFVTTAVANTLYQLPGGDAEPSVIRAVFSLSEQLPDNVKAAISSSDAGSARLSSSALAFLNALAATRPVLASWLEAKPGDAVPALGFSIKFRVNRADEIGGDQIIEWTLETGTRRIHPTDKDLRGRWQFGEPVHLSLRWATGSPWRPIADRARPDLQIKDDTATFVYPDGWALFKLIDLNRLYLGAGWQEGGGMLMLTVPVQRAAPETGNFLRSEARVFIRLLLLGPPNPQGQVQTLVFPVFPAYAPSS